MWPLAAEVLRAPSRPRSPSSLPGRRWAPQPLSRARRRHALCVEVGQVLAMPGRRERRLLEIRLMHRQARRQRRRLRQLVRQMRALRLAPSPD